MTRIIIALFAFAVAASIPAFAMPGDHDFKTPQDVAKFYDEQRDNSGE